MEADVTLVCGGVDRLGPIGGLTYAGAERRRPGEDGWHVDLHGRDGALRLTVRRAPGAPEALLRDVELRFELPPGEWVLNAPGNHCRADLSVAALAKPLPVFTAGDTLGSPGLMAFTGGDETLLLWPLCRTEVGEIDVDARGVTIRTGLAARMAGGDHETWGTLYLDRVAGSWRSALPRWHERLGLRAPEAPEWMRAAHVYEAHVGFSVFAGGHRYERYREVADLRADLPRLRELGFDVLQLMPRHPYPSYNVHDYADVTTTWGDEAELRELVAEGHRRGMRVLLDVIVHGVVDREVLDETVAAVTAGPYAERLADGTIDYLSRRAEDVAWSRHIVEYAPYWREGASERHPLAEAHPEWFMRDSAGRITRRYTKAFDIAHREWQRYFVDRCVELVERLGVDGFRVDAPTYNQFATWAPGRAARASYGAMSSLEVLEALRQALGPDRVVYTEPTGALFRAAAQATYNYDEHWLVEALLGEPHPLRDRLVRDAGELARWLADRDAAMPPGSTIVHHIDSHDSIWWRLPGAQWRRERFGRDAAVALLAVFATIGGAFMTFMGGEDAIERELRWAHELRRTLPDTVEYDALGDVLVVRRGSTLVAVNLARRRVSARLGRREIEFAPFQVRVLRRSASSIITAS